jgi:hypothetical protein
MMQSFKRQQEKKLLSPQDAAATLCACAQISIEPSILAHVTTDREILRSINLLIYLTKAAIIINWLRLLERNCPTDEKTQTVLVAFEQLIFSEVPNDGRRMLAEYIRNLTLSVTELHRIARMENAPEKDVSAAMLKWCKGWLGTISNDEIFLKRTSLLYGAGFFAQIHGAMDSLAKSVEAVLYEKK